ncbi:MAG: alpha/beta hydrolase [Draconibacterium sp.]
MNKFLSIFVIVTASFCSVLSVKAADVTQTTTFSQSMNKDIGVVVITPENYTTDENYPVLYLLHGYSGNQNDWITKVPEIKDYADQYRFIIVCPDGGFSSWYFDSPVDKNWMYETYVSDELIKWVDKNYSTKAAPAGRAITGLSMGGHGALYLAFRHQDVFGAAGSMSGGIDIRPFPNNWELSKRLGNYAENKENWEENSVINLVYKLSPNSLQITFDCGTSDFFYNVNCRLHEKLMERNIPHDFTVRPGGHTWEYWTNSIAFQAVFFHHFFDQSTDK